MLPHAGGEHIRISLPLWLFLVAGSDGQEVQVTPAQVISPDLPGRKVGIMGCAADTLPAAVHLDGADVLVHPATSATVSFCQLHCWQVCLLKHW